MDKEPFEFPPEMFSQVPLFAEIAKAMSWSGGPINWDIARQIATAMAASEHGAPIIDTDVDELREAARLAEAWLTEVTGLAPPPAPGRFVAMNSSVWVDHAITTYAELLDPLGGKISGSLAMDDAEQAPMAAVVKQIIPLFVGIQCGGVLGGLSRSILTSYDVPIPVEEEGLVPILVQHVDAHAKEFMLDRRETRYWVALHASAHRMLYESLAWSRATFWSMYHAYLAAIDVNLSETMNHLQSLDITNPEQLQSAIGDNLFGLGDGAGGPSLARLQQFLGLIEAAASKAVAEVAHGRLVTLPAIEESLMRRRAEGAAGERALERFVGIEIPDDVQRRAADFADYAVKAGGWQLLFRMWDDPEGAPTSEEFFSPQEWVSRLS